MKKFRLYYILTLLGFGLLLSNCDNGNESVNDTNKDVTITYYANGVTIATDMANTSSTYTIASLDVEASEGYEFVGWYFDSDFLNKADDTFEIKGDISLYAKFEKIAEEKVQYSIFFDSDGGNGSYQPITSAESETIVLPDGSNLEKENYIFDGWLDTINNQVYEGSSSYFNTSCPDCF